MDQHRRPNLYPTRDRNETLLFSYNSSCQWHPIGISGWTYHKFYLKFRDWGAKNRSLPQELNAPWSPDSKYSVKNIVVFQLYVRPKLPSPILIPCSWYIHKYLFGSTVISMAHGICTPAALLSTLQCDAYQVIYLATELYGLLICGFGPEQCPFPLREQIINTERCWPNARDYTKTWLPDAPISWMMINQENVHVPIEVLNIIAFPPNGQFHNSGIPTFWHLQGKWPLLYKLVQLAS